MTDLDRYISLTSSCIEEMRKNGRKFRTMSCATAAEFLGNGISIKVGPGAGSGIVMKSETFLELGSPAAGSCAFTIYSNNSRRIRDGRICLVGPDVAESSGARPFGQVIMISGEELTDKDYLSLHKCQYIGDQIEGYMVKSTPGRIWSRVSKEAVKKGFDFRFLGTALIKLVKDRIPKTSSAEVIFVTSDKSDVMLLGGIAERITQFYQDIKAKFWKDKGIDIYECAFHGDCSSCSEREICDEVNKISKARRRKLKRFSD